MCARLEWSDWRYYAILRITQSSSLAPQASSSPAPSATPPTPSQPPFVTKTEICKIVQVDQKVIFAEPRTRAECIAACGANEQSNPARRCEWGEETLRAHPTNICSIRRKNGVELFESINTRFQCRMECRARETTNPESSCVWGGENIKGM